MTGMVNMSDAAKAAYDAAKKFIEETKRESRTKISFDHHSFRQLTEIPPEIADLKRLTSIDLSKTRVHDLGPIRDCTSLNDLTCYRTDVVDLSPISALTSLRFLDLRRTKVDDLSPISDLTGLLLLYLGQTGVTDLSSIKRLTNLQSITIDETLVRDLSPISGHTELSYLSLRRTMVSDLTPIQALTLLTDLHVEGSNVMDLRPIINMKKLSDGRLGGIGFSATPAAKMDKALARLAMIEDDSHRAIEVLAYLETLPRWPEPLPWLADAFTENEPPEQDPALPLIWGEKGFNFLANSIDGDPVTEAALDDVRALLEDLRRKGNRHDDLYHLAGELQDRTKGDVRDLNLIKLHLSYQKLQRIYWSRNQRAERFDDETVGTLDSVLGILPGVTLADEGVKELIKRQESDRLTASPPETVQAEEGILIAVQQDDAPFEDAVKDVAWAVLQPGQNDRLAATRSVFSRNTVIAVLRFLRNDPLGAGITSGAVIVFAQNYGPALLALAQTMGVDAFTWAQAVLSSISRGAEVTMGIAREGLTSGVIHRPRRTTREH